MTGRRALAVVLVVALGAGGCSDDDGGGQREGVDAMLQSIADDAIVPGYETLVRAFDGLGDVVEELCAGPSPSTRRAAQDGWRQVSRAWRATRPFGVGPAMERRLAAAVAFAARTGTFGELLASDTPVDVPGLAAEGASVKGISALELGLFGEGAETLETAEGARRCEYVTSATTLAREAAAEVLGDWTSGYRDTFIEGMDGDPQSSVDAIVNETIFRLTEMDDQGLRALTEARSPEELAASRSDGPAAFHLAELRATFDGVTTVFDAGLFDLVAARSTDTAERLQAAAAAATEAVQALPDSVTESFDDPEVTAAAQEAVMALKVLLSTEVASELGVTISFSDADGDS